MEETGGEKQAARSPKEGRDNTMSEFQIKRATRQGVKPLIGLYSESGCGKTYSSLLLARGLVGPTGTILLVDTESGRGSQFADEIPGGYDVAEIRDDFSPVRYIEALKQAEKAGYAVVIFDSMSHEWEGLGGVLDWAGKNEAAGKKGPQIWHDPKIAHAKMLLAITQSPLAVICCLRAKYKTRFPKKGAATKDVVKDDYTTPIQAEDFIFEMLVHMEILRDHTALVTKGGPPSLEPILPNGRKITIADGAAIAKWCAAPPIPGKTADPLKPSAAPAERDAAKSSSRQALKKELWALTDKIHKGDMLDGKRLLEQWLWDELCMGDQENLDALDEAGYRRVIEKVKGKLK